MAGRNVEDRVTDTSDEELKPSLRAFKLSLAYFPSKVIFRPFFRRRLARHLESKPGIWAKRTQCAKLLAYRAHGSFQSPLPPPFPSFHLSFCASNPFNFLFVFLLSTLFFSRPRRFSVFLFPVPFPSAQRWLVISICRHSRNCWPRRGASRWNRAAEMPERALAKQTRCQLCARLLRFARARVEQHSRWLVCSPTSTPDHSAGFNVPDESRNAK